MPLARGTINGVTGLLRRAAGFVAKCCCKRWKCDPSTYTCTEDPSGEYSSEQECLDKCQRYSCDTATYTCVADAAGTYETYDKCISACLPPKYKCDTATYDCTEDPNGPYDTLKDCEDNCKEPKYYCCGSPGSPEDRDCYDQPCADLGLDEFGVYDTQGECDTNCEAPHYACDPTTYLCYETPTGPYTDPALCASECVPRYTCNPSTGRCFVDPSGVYLSLSECEANCKKYYCCGSPGSGDDRDCYPTPCADLGLDEFGVYDTPFECDTNCKPPVYYCCEDSQGAKSCESSPCTSLGLFDSCFEASGAPCEFTNKDDCDASCVVRDYPYYCFRAADGTEYCARQDPGNNDDQISGPYLNDDTCGGDCGKKKYACVDNPDGTRTCIEDPNGPYDNDTCDNQCLPKRYKCEPLPTGDVECVEDPFGPYDEPTCGGNCTPPRYDCIAQPDGSTVCQEQRGGTFTEPTCGGGCLPSPSGWCCTDYGPTTRTKAECNSIGGDFYLTYEDAVADCGCDCTLGGEYCFDLGQPCGAPPPPATLCGPGTNTGWVEPYYPFRRSEQGGWGALMCWNGDCSPLQPLIDAGATTFITWTDYVNEIVTEASNECCFGIAGRMVYRYRTFVLNCRKKVWEEAPNVSAGFDNVQEYRPNDAEECLGGWPKPRPEIPSAIPRDDGPVCLPAVNPLP